MRTVARALVALLLLAAPVAGQVYTATGLPTGPVKFVAPAGALVVVDGQVSADRAVLEPGAEAVVIVGGYTLDLVFMDQETGQERGATMDVGEVMDVCAVVRKDGARVAASEDCGCRFGGVPELWPGAVSFASDNPAVATFTPGPVCSRGGGA